MIELISVSSLRGPAKAEPPEKRKNQKMKSPQCSYTSLASLVNEVIAAAPGTQLSCDDIFDAANDECLIFLLAQRYGHIADFTFVTHSSIANLREMETARRDAAAGWHGRVDVPIGPTGRLCLVMDIVLEATQQQFHRVRSPLPRPFQLISTFFKAFQRISNQKL
jgi:hypothetical protein